MSHEARATLDNRITLQKLEIFELVIELGSVSRAAEMLFVAQPVVTAHIRSLEERIGQPLLRRAGRHLELTEAGEAAHLWAGAVLSRSRDFARELEDLAGGNAGLVEVSASMSLGSYALPPTMARFRREHPNVELILNVTDTDSALREIDTGAADFGVVVAMGNPVLPGLTGEYLVSEPLVLVTASDELPDEISVEEIPALAFIESRIGLARRNLIDRILDHAGIFSRNIVLELGHPEAMKRAVRDGLGVVLLFRCAVQEELDAGTLREITINGLDSGELAAPVFLAYREEKRFSATQLKLMDAVRHDLHALRPPPDETPAVSAH